MTAFCEGKGFLGSGDLAFPVQTILMIFFDDVDVFMEIFLVMERFGTIENFIFFKVSFHLWMVIAAALPEKAHWCSYSFDR